MDISKEQFNQQAGKLLKYLMERLKIKSPPSNLKLVEDEENAKRPWAYTGNYNPDNKEITLFITHRHHVDILRSFAHEVIHHWQNENGQFDPNQTVDPTAQYAQKDGHLRKMEKQAYLLGNMIFRDHEDIERFGHTDIVNENVDPKFNRWVKSMVVSVEESLSERGQQHTDSADAYDIIKSGFRANSSSESLFNQACNEALGILKTNGTINDVNESELTNKSGVMNYSDEDSLEDEKLAKAERYFSIGQDEDSDNNYCWAWLDGRLQLKKGGTHGINFGHDRTDKTYKGWFDTTSKVLSVVFPSGHDGKTKSDIPEKVYTTLINKFKPLQIEVF